MMLILLTLIASLLRFCLQLVNQKSDLMKERIKDINPDWSSNCLKSFIQKYMRNFLITI